MTDPTTFQRNDGGRAAAGFRGEARDCVTRAVAIATERPYLEVYNRISEGCRTQRRGRHQQTRLRSARNGVYTNRTWFKAYLVELGFRWTPIMGIGTGCTVHLRADELPSGRLIVSVSKHWVAVLDGTVHDTHDCTRGGERCVYGYWRKIDTSA